MSHALGMKPKFGKSLSAPTRHICFVYPGDLNTATGGYAYARHIMQALIHAGWQVHPLALGEGFPEPSSAVCESALQKLNQVPKNHMLVIDGLALGVLPQAAKSLHQSTRPFTALVHHPLAREAGISTHRAQALHQSEKQALQYAAGVMVTSHETARTVCADFDVPIERIAVALPGTDRPLFEGADAPKSKADNSPLQLLSVGSLVPRKGFDLLIEALAGLVNLNWQLTIVGDDTRDESVTKQVQALIERYALQNRVTCTGAVDTASLLNHYALADIFVLASHYEGYGMAFAEALAAGLPIIGTTGGAIPDTVPLSAGRLVKPGDVTALRSTLYEVITDDDLRKNLRQGALVCAENLPTWQQSAVIFANSVIANHNR